MGPSGTPGYIAIGVDADTLVVRNANELERAVLKQRPLHAAATGINANTKKDYGMTSNDAILSPSSSKKNRRSTGLPGKFPVSRLVTTVFPAC